MGLDSYLDTLSNDGQQISEAGEFSINSRDALRKLREYQLEDKGEFVCHLVAAVVSAGGDYLQYSVTPHGLVFTMDLPRPELQQLELLFNAPFQPKSERWQKELATGANGAFGLSPLALTLETWDHERREGYSLNLLKEDDNLEALKGPWLKGVQGTRLKVVVKPPNARGFKMSKFTAPVRRQISERCGLAPILIRMQGGKTGWGFSYSSKTVGHEFWQSSVDHPGCQLTEQTEPYGSKVWRRFEHDEPFTAYLSLEAVKEPDIKIVVNGVAYTLPKGLSVDAPMLKAVVAAPFLKKDLSQSQLRDDSAMSGIVRWIEQKAAELVLHRCASSHPMTGRALRFFNKHLIERYGDGEEEKRPEEVEHWFEQCELLEQADDNEHFRSVLNEAKSLEPGRRKSVLRRLRSTQAAYLRASFRKFEWPKIKKTLRNLNQIPLERSAEADEGLQALRHLIPDAEPGAVCEIRPDLVWFHQRRALIHLLRGEESEARVHLDEAGGFWKFYLEAHLCEDPAEAEEWLNRALKLQSEQLLLGDLAEFCYQRESWAEGLEWRASQLKKRPVPYHLWCRLRAIEAAQHGTRSQWAFGVASAGIAELSARSPRDSKSLHLEFRQYSNEDWYRVMSEVEVDTLTGARGRYHYQRGYWALRRAGAVDQARTYLFRRLLLASISDRDPEVLRVPSVSSL